MYIYKCKVARVIDGDTLDLDIDLGFNVTKRERVRLYGVDTPEVFGAKASAAGKLASEFTREWINSKTMNTGLPGYFEYHSIKYDYKDKYGRGLGALKFVHTDMERISDLCEDLIKNNHIK